MRPASTGHGFRSAVAGVPAARKLPRHGRRYRCLARSTAARCCAELSPRKTLRVAHGLPSTTRRPARPARFARLSTPSWSSSVPSRRRPGHRVAPGIGGLLAVATSPWFTCPAPDPHENLPDSPCRSTSTAPATAPASSPASRPKTCRRFACSGRMPCATSPAGARNSCSLARRLVYKQHDSLLTCFRSEGSCTDTEQHHYPRLRGQHVYRLDLPIFPTYRMLLIECSAFLSNSQRYSCMWNFHGTRKYRVLFARSESTSAGGSEIRNDSGERPQPQAIAVLTGPMQTGRSAGSTRGAINHPAGVAPWPQGHENIDGTMSGYCAMMAMLAVAARSFTPPPRPFVPHGATPSSGYASSGPPQQEMTVRSCSPADR